MQIFAKCKEYMHEAERCTVAPARVVERLSEEHVKGLEIAFNSFVWYRFAFLLSLWLRLISTFTGYKEARHMVVEYVACGGFVIRCSSLCCSLFLLLLLPFSTGDCFSFFSLYLRPSSSKLNRLHRNSTLFASDG